MIPRRAQPSPSSGELPRQPVEALPTTGAPILRPVVLRSVALQSQDALAGYGARNWIDTALMAGEWLIIGVLIAGVGFWIANGPGYDWIYSRAVSQQAQPAEHIAVATQVPPTERVVTPARYPELGHALPSSNRPVPRHADEGADLAPAPAAPQLTSGPKRRAWKPGIISEPSEWQPSTVVAASPTPRPAAGSGQPAAISEPPTPQPTLISEPPTAVPTPTPPPDPRPRHLQAPAAGLDTSVAEVFLRDGAWQVADYAAGYHHGTGVPGAGNVVMAGHKGVRGAVFARLERLRVGDEIFVDTLDRRYRYLVRETRRVWPSEVEVMFPTSTPTLTLLTCTNWDLQRFVVIADLVDSAPLAVSAGG